MKESLQTDQIDNSDIGDKEVFSYPPIEHQPPSGCRQELFIGAGLGGPFFVVALIHLAHTNPEVSQAFHHLQNTLVHLFEKSP